MSDLLAEPHIVFDDPDWRPTQWGCILDSGAVGVYYQDRETYPGETVMVEIVSAKGAHKMGDKVHWTRPRVSPILPRCPTCGQIVRR